MTLCQVCNNITFPQASANTNHDGYQTFKAILHPTLEALNQSATRDKCRFCIFLAGIINNRQQLGDQVWGSDTQAGSGISLEVDFLSSRNPPSNPNMETPGLRGLPGDIAIRHPFGVDDLRIRNPEVISRATWEPGHDAESMSNPSASAFTYDLPGPDNQDTTVDDSTGSKATLSLASGWIKQCKSQHPTCQQPSSSDPSQAPARLLDVSFVKDSPGKVLLVSSLSGKNIEYATLSHRWDPNHSCNTTTLNQVLHQTQGIALTQLTKTFAEACITTHSLGLRYIWIDSLCIVQDSAEDKMTEIPKMGVYYQNAQVNLAASTASETGEGGLWRRRDGRATKPFSGVHITLALPGPYLPRQATLTVAPVLRCEPSHLDTRGWILQERIFPIRTIFFDPYWIGFECAEASASENYPWGVKRGNQPLAHALEKSMATILKRDGNLATMGGVLRGNQAQSGQGHGGPAEERRDAMRRQSHYWQWYRIVQEYTKRQLSFSSDRLLAISGVAERLQNIVHDKYCAGMWMDRLLDCLQWQHYGGVVRQEAYRAPTWSWASLDHDGQSIASTGGVVYDHEIPQTTYPLIRVVDVSWTCRTSNPFGDLSGAKLVLDGRPLRALIYASEGASSDSDTSVESLEDIRETEAEEPDPTSNVSLVSQHFDRQKWRVRATGKTSSGKLGRVDGVFAPDITNWEADVGSSGVYLLPLVMRHLTFPNTVDLACLVLKEVGNGLFERIGFSRPEGRILPRAWKRQLTLV
ncbi:heterokaryon incompatibility protein-domain-containing protein [Podospora australis]|uniref:Heterokaryon incompatibility protein-domain-containing protein n=1 Tax=Podospora australis TaxID=1536484 RepID=A0AAN6WL08_9PEZI|nr:heterokaryon incompatibility protein-domain-containing protein [Podospora australis]